MKFFALFIYRPVATILISLAITLCGVLGFRLLPVAPLPQVDFPVIMISASLPGASPETMASSVATPLERSLGRIAGVSEMTSTSSLGSTRIIMEFNFDRDINGAARDVQAAINAAQSLLPSGMPSRPTYRKANPSDAPIMILTLTSDTYSQGELYDFASTQLAQTIAQIDGVGDVDVGGSSLPAVRVDLNPQALFNQGVSLDAVRTAIDNANVRKPQGALEDHSSRWQVQTNDELKTAAEYQPLIVHYNNGAAVRLGDVAQISDSVQDVRNARDDQRKASHFADDPQAAGSQYHPDGRQHSRPPAGAAKTIPAAIDLQIAQDRSPTIRASLEEVEQTLVISVALVILVVFLFLRSRAGDADPGGGRSGLADWHLCGDVSLRFQPQQPVADGPDHRHRFRGRRCYRGAGEYLPSS
ncbi:Multidrug transporter MdtC [Raoultella planticola]|uniref:Multidrug transporter MdtC n=1 Tax=Raoultella planticola TaxID=575 RepID=A0A485AAS8_RAOPL|nr:Multidrug transporter MdtC [Raoultella planticola]